MIEDILETDWRFQRATEAPLDAGSSRRDGLGVPRRTANFI
jgi:hypothetical protein